MHGAADPHIGLGNDVHLVVAILWSKRIVWIDQTFDVRQAIGEHVAHAEAAAASALHNPVHLRTVASSGVASAVRGSTPKHRWGRP